MQFAQKRSKANVKNLTKFYAIFFFDTISNRQCIGAARRWINLEFEVISNACDK